MKFDKFEGIPPVHALHSDATEGEVKGVNNLSEEGALSKEASYKASDEASSEVEETAFTRQSDLNAYARGLSIPPEVIEKWISAGLLFPDEIRMAEKIIKILREKIKVY